MVGEREGGLLAGWLQASLVDRTPQGTFGTEFSVFAHLCPALGTGPGVSCGASLGWRGACLSLPGALLGWAGRRAEALEPGPQGVFAWAQKAPKPRFQGAFSALVPHVEGPEVPPSQQVRR